MGLPGYCRVLSLLRALHMEEVAEKMIKFRKGKIKVLFSGKTWSFGIDTREIYLVKIQRDCYVEGISFLGIYFLCFWLEIDVGR